jgi:hypothetical protein
MENKYDDNGIRIKRKNMSRDFKVRVSVAAKPVLKTQIWVVILAVGRGASSIFSSMNRLILPP